jgi:trehalose 6-phosphate synthase
MNLVAKEYVAAQDPEDPGVLVLSRFAGAARQMPDAVIVNPYSREEMSEALKRALTMDRDERIRRWERLIDGVRAYDVKAWRDAFVEALKAAREPPLPLFPSPMSTILREVIEAETPLGATPRRAAPRRAAREPSRPLGRPGEA